MNSPNARLTRVDLALVVLLAALIAVFFWRILTPNPADRAQFPPGDFTDQFYAFRLVEARALAAGHLPLWSENYNSGHPFLADVQAAVFYPIGLINTLLNVAVLGPNFSLFSLELEALLHFWLAGVLTFLFARQIMSSRAGAFGAALVFTFGGYLTSYPSLQLAILETAAWLPLALLFVRMASTGRRQVPWLLAAGLTLGVAALAGHPQTFVFVLAACVLYQVYLDWSAEAARSTAALLRRSAPRVLLMVAVALGLAAVQLIPSIEYQRLSTREALSFQQAAAGLPTLDLLQFIFPGFTSAFASPLYIGILPLWLALLALARRERERAFWGLTALGALLLSFGFYVFAFAWVYLLLPGAGLFRQQERLAFIVSFALALLAGFGLQDLAEIAERMRAGAARHLYLLLPAGAVLSLALLVTFFAAGVERSSGRLAFLGDRAGLMVILFVLSALLAGARLSGRLAPRSFALLALALVLFDLWSVTEPANKSAVADRYAPNETVETIKQDTGIFRVMADPQVAQGHWGIGYQLEETSGISPLRLAHYDAVLALGP
ncbi:MAG: YfhO family protein, partial [Rudaea sp.]